MKNKKLIIFLTVVLIIFVFLMIFKSSILKIIYPKKYEQEVSTYSQEYNVEEELIYAVIKAESNFYEKAVSNKMQ